MRHMMTVHFLATIEILGINPYVLVSAEQAELLQPGWRKPMPVRVQINGFPTPPWLINMVPVGDGSFYLYLAGVVRKASGTKVGDVVMVDVDFDADYRGGPAELPEWFRGPLESDPVAKAAWDALTPSRQKEVVRYLSALKSDEARGRNLDKVMRMLGGEVGRFMGRDWKDGQ